MHWQQQEMSQCRAMAMPQHSLLPAASDTLHTVKMRVMTATGQAASMIQWILVATSHPFGTAKRRKMMR